MRRDSESADWVAMTGALDPFSTFTLVLPISGPNHGARFTLRVGDSGCPWRIPSAIAPDSVEIFRQCLREIAATFTTFTTVTVVLGLALPCPVLSLRCRCQAELLLARE